MPLARKRLFAGTSFSTRFLGAVLLLVVIEAVGIYTFGENVTRARVDPELLNEAGRMRVLVMQADALAHHFRYARTDSIRQEVEQKLREASSEIGAITDRLRTDVYSESARSHLEDAPVHLAPRLQSYAAAAAALASESDRQSQRVAISGIAQQTERLRDDIDHFTHLIESDYRQAVNRGQQVYLAVGALTFILLLVLGLFVFRPMEVTLRDELQQSRYHERRFRLLVENAYDLISVLNGDGTFRYASPSLRRMSGYTPEDMAGRSAIDIVHPEDREFIIERLASLFDSSAGTALDAEFRILTKGGEERVLESIGQNLIDDPGVGGIVVNSRDVTDRKRAEKELLLYRDELEERVLHRTKDLETANYDLKEEIMRRWEAEANLIDRERHFRRVIMGASDPIFIQELGPEGILTRYSEVNEAAVRHLGYTREELLNLSPRELVEGFDELESEDFGWMAGERTLVIEMSLIAKDGRRLPFECRLDLHEIGDRKVLMCLARDISKRIAVERAMREENEELELRVAERTSELERRTAELEAANEELEAFAYSVSHDLRAPIRSLVGFSRLVVERMNGSADETIYHYLTRIQANAAKMGSLVDDLLAYSRIGRATARRAKIDPRSLVEEILRDLLTTDRYGIDVQIDDLPPVDADATLLRQVYQNLLSNAVKFTREAPSPCITIGAKELHGETVYYVKDNGVGFDMKYADKLFGVFQRLHSSEAFEGTGAGLAIVERIISKHGGRVWAESAPNAGATFYFTLGGGMRAAQTNQTPDRPLRSPVENLQLKD